MSTRISLSESGLSQPCAPMFVFLCGGSQAPAGCFKLLSHCVSPATLSTWMPHSGSEGRPSLPATSEFPGPSACDSPHTHIQAAACSWLLPSQGSRQEAQRHARWSLFG